MQSFRRSIRQSLRRRTSTASGSPDDRRRIAGSLNVEEGQKVKGYRGRSSTEPASELSPAHPGGLQVRMPPHMQSQHDSSVSDWRVY